MVGLGGAAVLVGFFLGGGIRVTVNGVLLQEKDRSVKSLLHRCLLQKSHKAPNVFWFFYEAAKAFDQGGDRDCSETVCLMDAVGPHSSVGCWLLFFFCRIDLIRVRFW